MVSPEGQSVASLPSFRAGENAHFTSENALYLNSPVCGSRPGVPSVKAMGMSASSGQVLGMNLTRRISVRNEGMSLWKEEH